MSNGSEGYASEPVSQIGFIRITRSVCLRDFAVFGLFSSIGTKGLPLGMAVKCMHRLISTGLLSMYAFHRKRDYIRKGGIL